MIADYDAFIAHLRSTGRLKLLPRVLRELRAEAARAQHLSSTKQTAATHPSLISGWRQIQDGVLTDHTAKGALVDIYRKIIA